MEAQGEKKSTAMEAQGEKKSTAMEAQGEKKSTAMEAQGANFSCPWGLCQLAAVLPSFDRALHGHFLPG